MSLEKNSPEVKEHNSLYEMNPILAKLDNVWVSLGLLFFASLIVHFSLIENLGLISQSYENYFYLLMEDKPESYSLTQELEVGVNLLNYLKMSFPESVLPGLALVIIQALIGFFTFLFCKELKIKYPIVFGILMVAHPFTVESLSTIYFITQPIGLFFLTFGYWLFLKGLNSEKIIISILGFVGVLASSYISFSAVLLPLGMMIIAIKKGFSPVSLPSILAILGLVIGIFFSSMHMENANVSFFQNLKMEISDGTKDEKFSIIDHVRPQADLSRETSPAEIGLGATGFYFSRFFFSLKNSLTYGSDYFYSLSSHLEIPFLLSILILCLVGFRNQLADSPGVGIGLGLFLLAILPKLGFFQTNPLVDEFLADYNAYFSLFGLTVFTGALVTYLANQNDILKIAGYSFCFIFVSFMMFRGATYNRTFNDEFKVLWNALSVNPKAANLYLGLSTLYKKREKITASREVYTKAFGIPGVEDNLKVLEDILLSYRKESNNEKIYETLMYIGLRSIQEEDYKRAYEVAYDAYQANSFWAGDKLITGLAQTYQTESPEFIEASPVSTYISNFSFDNIFPNAMSEVKSESP